MTADDSYSVNEMQDDRRRSPRVAIQRPVKLQCGLTGRYLGGHTLDVSDSGLLIELNYPTSLRPGAPLKLALDLTGKHPVVRQADMIDAKVVRRLQLGETCRVAVDYDSQQGEMTLSEAA